MAALLLAAGTKGKRFTLPNSRIMIHQPVGGITGTSEDIKRQAQEISIMKKACNKILAECTGKAIEQIRKDSDRDYYMSATEAVKYGIVDSVIEKTAISKVSV